MANSVKVVPRSPLDNRRNSMFARKVSISPKPMSRRVIPGKSAALFKKS